jgi:hypothetical protein
MSRPLGFPLVRSLSTIESNLTAMQLSRANKIAAPVSSETLARILSFLSFTMLHQMRAPAAAPDESTSGWWASPRWRHPWEDSAAASPFLFSSLGLLYSTQDRAKHRQPASSGAVSPLSEARDHRWVDTPPLSRFTVGLYPHAPSQIKDQQWFFYPQYRLSKMRWPRWAQARWWRLTSSRMTAEIYVSDDNP